jgi:hypothetical protein
VDGFYKGIFEPYPGRSSQDAVEFHHNGRGAKDATHQTVELLSRELSYFNCNKHNNKKIHFKILHLKMNLWMVNRVPVFKR